MPEYASAGQPALARADEPGCWSQTFPGTAGQVPLARRFLAGVLAGCPAAGDALLCLSEVVTNAVLHSRSARPGGHVAVRVSRLPAWLLVEVTDDGGLWAPRPPGRDHGRGLDIVRALAAYLHISDPDADAPARTVTFGLRLP